MDYLCPRIFSLILDAMKVALFGKTISANDAPYLYTYMNLFLMLSGKKSVSTGSQYYL